MYLGLNFFFFLYTFDQPSQRKYIKYLVNDNIQNELFIKTEENNISKNINEIFSVFDKYVTLFDFYFDFLNFRKNNLDEETIKYIDYKKDELKQLKQIKYDYQQNDETNRTQKHTNCIFEAHRKSTAAKQRKTSKDTKKQPPIFSYGRLLSLVYHN